MASPSDPLDILDAVHPLDGPNPPQPPEPLGAAVVTAADYPTEGAPPFINRRLSLTEWDAYVASYLFTWRLPRHLTLHHTWRPDQRSWAGINSMRAMQRFYAGKGWTSAPHIYAAPDGIWLATPLHRIGIHAGAGNGSVREGWYSIGLEVVWNGDEGPPAGPAWAGAKAVIRGLAARCGTSAPEILNFHRDFSTKTCPGSTVTRAWVLGELAAPAAPAPAPILGGPSVPATTLIAYLDPRTPHLTWQQRQSIVCAYTTFGAYTGIGNLRPFAQAVKEASDRDAAGVYRPFNSRRFRENYNPAGLGATNDGAEGARFATIEAGVAAQYAHLLCYAARPETLPPELYQLSLTSPRRAALQRAYGLGAAPTWQALNGRWAYPGPTYGQDILRIAEEIERAA
jgi:hypothetical protein